MHKLKVEILAVAAVAGATLGFELLQTKVLSALYFNHVVYVTVTIALMGFGISGVAISLVGRRVLTEARPLAAICAGCLAVSMFLCLAAASHIPAALGALPTAAKLLLSYVVLVIPFLFAGAALGLLFMANGARIHTLYMVDLVASAGFALGFCLLLRPLGAAGFAWACIGVALAAFLLLGTAAGLKRHSLVLVPVALLGGLMLAPAGFIGQRPEAYKSAAQFFREGREAVASRWTVTAKIDVWPYGDRTRDHGQEPGGPPADMKITQDNDAHTDMLGRAERKRIFEAARRGEAWEPVAIAYLLRRDPKDVLVIGVGGGKDIVEARAYRAERIVGAELNPATVDLVSGRFRDYAEWPGWPAVELIPTEGRHFVRTGGRQYDVIMMSGVDTFAALSSGAYVLSENYLYTVEAIKDYLAALKPGGVLAFYRWFFKTPRESLRLANLYLEAAGELGLSNPSNAFMVIASGDWAATLIKNGAPFTPEEVTTAVAQTERRARTGERGEGIVYLPKVLPAPEQAVLESRVFAEAPELAIAREAFGRLLEPGADRRRFEDEYVYNITPVRDDRPFFFEYHRLGRHGETQTYWLKGGSTSQVTALRSSAVHSVLYLLLASSALVGGCAMFVPLFVFNRQGLRVENGLSLAATFAALGVGFMLVEVGLMQKLALYLGHPMYSVAVVLAGMLFFAGLGAFLAGRLRLGLDGKVGLGMLGSVLLIGLWLALGRPLLEPTSGWPLHERVLLCLLTLAPLGLVMGVPFATCLRYLEDRHPAFIPWAWGINGITSVVASVGAIVIAMRTGFTLVLITGMATYFAGFLAFLAHRRPWRAAAPARAGVD